MSLENTRKPRLLALLHLPPPIHGVTVINQAIVSSEIFRKRFELQVIPLRFAKSISDIGTRNFAKALRALAVLGRLAYRLCLARPDAVYLSLSPTGVAFLRDLLFVAAIRLFMVPRIYHLHGKGVRDGSARSRLHRALYAWAFRNAEVIHLSERHFEDVSEFVTRTRFHVVPNGITVPSGFLSPPRERDAADAPPHLLYLSNMLRAKGPLVLLDALAILKGAGIRFRATFAGAWSEEQVKNAMFELRRCHKLESAVRFTGFVSGREKEDLFNDTDILVFPTLFEAFGLVVVEAMAHGLPVVCTDEGALPEIVRDAETGLIVRKGDPEDLAYALKKLIADEKLRHRMGLAGHNRYRSHFTAEIFEDRLSSCLNEILSK